MPSYHSHCSLRKRLEESRRFSCPQNRSPSSIPCTEIFSQNQQNYQRQKEDQGKKNAWHYRHRTLTEGVFHLSFIDPSYPEGNHRVVENRKSWHQKYNWGELQRKLKTKNSTIVGSNCQTLKKETFESQAHWTLDENRRSHRKLT